jgi:hypothetical protein
MRSNAGGNMKGLILLAITLAAAAQAQQRTPCLKLSKVKIERHVLQQQDETVAFLNFKTQGCFILKGSQMPRVEFEAEPGLDITLVDIRFGDIDPSSAGTDAVRIRQVVVVLKMTASRDLPLGEKTLRGVMTYSVADKLGNVSPATLSLTVPFKVVPHQTHKQHSPFVNGFITSVEIIGLVVFSPLLFIFCLFNDGCG